MSRLGSALRERFFRSADRQDIDEAVGWLRAAVIAAAPGDDNGSAALSQLCGALRVRYESTDDGVVDLDDAIDAGREAVKRTPDTNPHYAGRSSSLASALLMRCLRTGARRRRAQLRRLALA